jgi:Family of unknown function (DUF5908)
MGLEIRQMVVKSTVTREPAGGSIESRREEDRRTLRQELLEECRRLIESTWNARGER